MIELDYQWFSEQLSGAIIISDAGSGTILDCNDAAESLTGRAKTETVGMHQSKLFPKSEAKNSRERFKSIVKKRIPLNYEAPVLTKEGEEVPLTVTTSVAKMDGKDVVMQVFTDKADFDQEEEYLLDPEDKFLWLMEQLPQGVAIVVDGVIDFANKAMREICGCSVGELKDKHFTDIMAAESQDIVAEKHKILLAGKRHSQTYQVHIRCKDGTIKNVEVSAGSLRYQGKPAVVVIFHEITMSQGTEQELKEAGAKYSAIVEQANDAIFIIQDSVFKFANNKTSDFLEYSMVELIGMDFHKVLAASSLELVADRYRRMMAGEEVLSTYIVDMIRKDGQLVPVDISCALIEYDGENADLIVARDITKHKQREENLQQAQTILDTMIDGITVTDMQGTITSITRATTIQLGYTKEELIGIMPTEFLFQEKDHPRFFEKISELLSGNPIETSEFVIIRKDGTEFTASINISLLKDAYGKPTGIVAVHRDISELKQAQEERESLLKEIEETNHSLTRSNRDLQDFVYVASHDLREPVRKISAFGQLVQDSLEGKLEEDDQENLYFMIDGATRMQQMIDDLLTYSRVTTKAKSVQEVNLNKVIKDLVSLELANQIEEINGTIEVPESLPAVSADDSQMHQLLQNLIGNGLKYYKKDVPPKIIVRAKSVEGNMVRVEVEDNGIGIEEKHGDEVFTMFRRLHSRGEYKGTGIGLAVCKRIVERHGGEIGMESVVGTGSTFWFTVPCEPSNSILMSKKHNHSPGGTLPPASSHGQSPQKRQNGN